MNPGGGSSHFLAQLAAWVSALVVLGVFIYLFFAFVIPNRYVWSPPADTLNIYCNALKRHDYRVAYNQLLTPTAEFPTETDFVSSLENADKVFGGLTGCTVYDVSKNDSSDTAKGSFSLTYGNGASEFFITGLAEVGGVWKITELDIRP